MRTLDRVAVFALIALLTWLLFMSFGRTDQRARYSLINLESFRSGEGALHRDVLSARAGLLNNYDPLDMDLAQMTEGVNGALLSVSTDSERDYARTLLLILRRQKALANQFKSANALVQNSLAYFAAYKGQVSAAAVHPHVQAEVDRLSSAMLKLNLNGSKQAQADVGRSIMVLEMSCDQKPCDADVHGLIAHARLLREQLPLVSTTIEQLVRSGSDAPVAGLRNAFMGHQTNREDYAARFRILLYLASLLLLYLLVRWGLAMRRQAAVLHRQVALEHAISHLSTRLIGASPDAIIACVGDALKGLSDVLGANRVLFVDHANGIYGAQQVPSPSSAQIDALRGCVRDRDEAGNSILRLSRQDAAASPIIDMLDALELDNIYCLSSPCMEGADNLLILGFPTTNSGWPTRQLAVLRAALDAISLSLDHASSERERRRLEAQLEHARRMETVGAFASGIAHNFNNLLGAISGHLEMAQDLDDLPATLEEHLGQMRISSERGHQLVRALLSYGRRHDRHRELTRLDDLVLESRNIARAALGPSYRCELDAGAGACQVLVDAVQLQQVILNLCHNAGQAMANGGVIRICTGVHVAQASPEGAGRHAGQEDRAFVRISDAGIGIEDDVQAKIFEPFFTTRESGTGLGLSTARDIVREHGGELTLDSKVGQGTHITILLPVPSQDVGGQVEPDSVRQGAGEAVLYVAINTDACAAGEDLLAALGYEPTGVPSLSKAIAILDAQPERFDAVVVSGYRLDADIRTFFARARRLAPRMARILAVHRPHEEDPQILASAHISAVLQFPLNARELAKMLDAMVNDPSRQLPGEKRSQGMW